MWAEEWEPLLEVGGLFWPRGRAYIQSGLSPPMGGDCDLRSEEEGDGWTDGRAEHHHLVSSSIRRWELTWRRVAGDRDVPEVAAAFSCRRSLRPRYPQVLGAWELVPKEPNL